jgi:K+-sensing histidine kinase KdpD
VCRAIVEAHHGSIAALNTADGARVLIELPIGDTPAVPAEGGTDEHIA